MILGIVMLVGIAAFFGYGQYEQAALANQAAATQGVPNVVESTGRAVAPSAVAASNRVVTTASVPTPAVAADSPAPIQRVTASSIGLDAKVAESPIVDGQWIIPKFEAGHLQGTAQPGTGGNVVLAGHVQSITSGDVFANLDGLKPGDTIKVYTSDATVTYVVQSVTRVSNDDLSVLEPGPRETLTLITCSGTWLPLQHDYSQRTVVVADRH